MVKNPRETPGAGPVRPLNQPEPVSVEEGEGRRPASLNMGRRRLVVASIDDVWEIDEEWWRKRPISRLYYRLTLEDGGSVTVFRDLHSGGWYQQQY